MIRPDGDLALYVAAGVGTLVVFVLAVAVLDAVTGLELSVATTATLGAGFLLFMGSYVVAMVVYRGVTNRERVE